MLVIAHRGACGYLPEHTLEAIAYGHALGADYLEIDVVATRDDQLIVIHDTTLERVTDVADRFPGRQRDDGRFYARDFDLAEIKTLSVRERRRRDGVTAVFPKRFPTGISGFEVPTLREEIKFIQGMNQATGRNVGVFAEVKKPAFHLQEGVDISALALDLLDDLGYRSREDNFYLQCFDAAETRRIRTELGCELRIIQLIEDNFANESDTDYDALRTRDGLQEISRYVEAIGPKITHVVQLGTIDGQPVSTGLVTLAHEFGMQVIPWTFRAEQLLPGFERLEEMVAWFAESIRVDGVFTDFPDRALAALKRQHSR
jgi:glycerophosphoryl diester phosphodiesterase